MDVRHPDIEEFVQMKQDLTKVTGANVSVFLRDDFMKAVEEDGDYYLRFPCDEESPLTFTREHKNFYNDGTSAFIITTYWSALSGELELGKLYKFDNAQVKRVRARELWNKIIHCAWNSAEPGLLFLNRHWDCSPDGVYDEYRMVGTNPCGEIGTQAYDSCRLLAINLYSFVKNPFTDFAEFDYELFYEKCYLQQKIADTIVDLEIDHINRILSKIDPKENRVEYELWTKVKQAGESSRRTGCGFTALADTLAAMNIQYDSDKALEVIECIMKTKFRAELTCSIDLAEEYGSFEGWDPYLEFSLDVDNEICKGNNSFYQMILVKFPDLAQRMFRVGRRNVSWSTVAPTGSVITCGFK